MATPTEVFALMKGFLDFDDTDIAYLTTLGPVFEKRGGRITDEFYETLSRYPSTAALIEGRVDALKATHHRYLAELFAGDYGDAYFQSRMRVGNVHVRIGLDPYYVEAVMSFLRTEGLLAIREEIGPDSAGHVAAYIKILDLDMLIINLAYGDERLNRLAKFTGMSRKLLETCIQRAN